MKLISPSKITLPLAGVLLLLGASPLLARVVPAWLPPPHECAVVDENFDDLRDAYDEAEASHDLLVKQAEDSKQRLALRKAHPGYTYFARFTKLAQGGEGEAYIWLIGNARFSGEKSSAQRDLQATYARTLVADHIAAAWFEDAIKPISKAKRALGEEGVCELLLIVTEKSEVAEVAAAAGYSLARILVSSKDEAKQAEGLAWYGKILEQWPETSYAEKAAPEYNRAKYLTVGGEPLEFEAKTVDGEAFKLSDYRGKVVVLDFWGFW